MVSIFPCASGAGAGILSSDLERRIERAAPQERIAVIVRLRDQLDHRTLAALQNEDEHPATRQRRVVSLLQARAQRAQPGIITRVADRERRGEARLMRSFWIINGLALEATPETLQELAARDDVAEIIPDRVFRMSAPVSVAPAAVAAGNWALDRLAVTELWDQNFRGEGAVVAILDTGVGGNHSDLMAKWRGGTNSWYDPHLNSTSPNDADGHGTQVAAIMVADSFGGMAVGMAPGARWIAAKVFDNNGYATFEKIIASFEWLLDPDQNPATADTPDVVNCSWDIESPNLDLIFRDVISSIKSAGISVVFAAGNGGPGAGTSLSPANYPEVLSVGSTNQSDLVSSFSSRGPSAFDGSAYPGIVAPGENVLTSDLQLIPGIAPSLRQVSGTSFAAPYVAGGIALLKAAARDKGLALTATQIEQAVMDSALDLGVVGPDNSYGKGFVDFARAARKLGVLPPAPRPGGDVSGDGAVTIRDVILDLRAAAGIPRTVDEMRNVMDNGDVHPLDPVTGTPDPDDAITISDVTTLLRKVLGLIPTPW